MLIGKQMSGYTKVLAQSVAILVQVNNTLAKCLITSHRFAHPSRTSKMHTVAHFIFTVICLDTVIPWGLLITIFPRMFWICFCSWLELGAKARLVSAEQSIADQSKAKQERSGGVPLPISPPLYVLHVFANAPFGLWVRTPN